MVSNDEASRAIWLDEASGALNGLCANATVIECSTLSPAWIRGLAMMVTQKGIRFLDAPVIGSRHQAVADELIFTVGGESETLAMTRGLLSVFGLFTMPVPQVPAVP